MGLISIGVRGWLGDKATEPSSSADVLLLIKGNLFTPNTPWLKPMMRQRSSVCVGNRVHPSLSLLWAIHHNLFLFVLSVMLWKLMDSHLWLGISPGDKAQHAAVIQNRVWSRLSMWHFMEMDRDLTRCWDYI